MNCERAERCILLAGSGELSERKRARLERHLAACTRCSDYREDLDRIMEAAGQVLPAGEPGRETVAAVLSAAREGIPPAARGAARKPGLRVFTARRPLLAVAAALLVCAAARFLWPGTMRASREAALPDIASIVPDGEIYLPADLVDEIAMLTWNNEWYIERVSDLQERKDVNPVDMDLMILQGLAI